MLLYCTRNYDHYNRRRGNRRRMRTAFAPPVTLAGLASRVLQQLVVAFAVGSIIAATTKCKSTTTAASAHHNNYAIIVSTSRYWFNYRHHTNALLIYEYLRNYGGYDNDHIILMLADEYIVNPRNPIKNRIYNTATDSVRKNHKHLVSSSSSSLYNGNDIEIDYRGEDVTLSNFIYALTGGGVGGEAATSTAGTGSRSGSHGSRRTNNSNSTNITPTRDNVRHLPTLSTNEDSHILVYMTGHGGDLFLKFQDEHEITSQQLYHVFHYMQTHHKYKEILFLVDTCQAFTLRDAIVKGTSIEDNNTTATPTLSTNAPPLRNINIVGTSLRGESSYAHSAHPILGLSVVEKYTHYMMQYVSTFQQQHQQHLPHSVSLQDILFTPFNSSKQTNSLHAHVGIDDSTSIRKLQDIPWNDYFIQNRFLDNLESSTTPKKRPIIRQVIDLTTLTSTTTTGRHPNSILPPTILNKRVNFRHFDDSSQKNRRLSSFTVPDVVLENNQCDENDTTTGTCSFTSELQ